MADIVSNATFLEAHPEFSGATEALVTNAIARAARRTNATVYQSAELAADAVILRAAVILVLSPYGRKMRSESPEQVLAWEYQLRQLQRQATTGLRVFVSLLGLLTVSKLLLFVVCAAA
jgi:hypothetical protein